MSEQLEPITLGDKVVKSAPEVSEVTLDPAKLTCRGVISTQNPDRSKDTVITAGIKTGNHKRNPQVFYQHYKQVGLAETPDPERAYTVEIKDGLAVAQTYFKQSCPDAMQVYRLIDDKVLRGLSIGFLALKAKVLREDEGEDRYGRIKGILFEEVELLEYSHVTLPDNPDALVILEKGYVGSEAMLPSVRKGLELSVAGLKARPESVSVPAEIEKLLAESREQKAQTEALKAEVERLKQQAPQEKIMPTNPDATGAGGTNPTPTPTPTPVVTPTPVQKGDDDLPYGARYLKACHARLLDLHDHHKSVGGSRRQEDALVKEYVRGAVAEVEKTLDRLADLFGELYPDLPQLDRPDDAEGASEKALEVKARIEKTLADFRMDRARKGQELTGTPARKACEDLAAWVLNKALAAKTAEELAAVKAEGAAAAARLKQLAEGLVPDAEDQRVAQVQPLIDGLLAELAETRKELKRAKAGR